LIKSPSGIKAVLVEDRKIDNELTGQLQMAEPTVSRRCTNTHQPSLEMLYEITRALKKDARNFLVPIRF
jgi:putative transcriptional regulator